MSEIPDHLRGDGPCTDCGTLDNIVWFTDNVLWNQVMAYPDPPSFGDPGGIVCIPCFVVRADEARLHMTGWRLLPEFHWETHVERAARRSAAEEG